MHEAILQWRQRHMERHLTANVFVRHLQTAEGDARVHELVLCSLYSARRCAGRVTSLRTARDALPDKECNIEFLLFVDERPQVIVCGVGQRVVASIVKSASGCVKSTRNAFEDREPSVKEVVEQFGHEQQKEGIRIPAAGRTTRRPPSLPGIERDRRRGKNLFRGRGHEADGFKEKARDASFI
jgi:hypothetical protein